MARDRGDAQRGCSAERCRGGAVITVGQASWSLPPPSLPRVAFCGLVDAFGCSSAACSVRLEWGRLPWSLQVRFRVRLLTTVCAPPMQMLGTLQKHRRAKLRRRVHRNVLSSMLPRRTVLVRRIARRLPRWPSLGSSIQAIECEAVGIAHAFLALRSRRQHAGIPMGTQLGHGLHD